MLIIFALICISCTKEDRQATKSIPEYTIDSSLEYDEFQKGLNLSNTLNPNNTFAIFDAANENQYLTITPNFKCARAKEIKRLIESSYVLSLPENYLENLQNKENSISINSVVEELSLRLDDLADGKVYSNKDCIFINSEKNGSIVVSISPKTIDNNGEFKFNDDTSYICSIDYSTFVHSSIQSDYSSEEDNTMLEKLSISFGLSNNYYLTCLNIPNKRKVIIENPEAQGTVPAEKIIDAIYKDLLPYMEEIKKDIEKNHPNSSNAPMSFSFVDDFSTIIKGTVKRYTDLFESIPAKQIKNSLKKNKSNYKVISKEENEKYSSYIFIVKKDDIEYSVKLCPLNTKEKIKGTIINNITKKITNITIEAE
jgi:archaellum component FlaF (FlaF/FlaG flagellin family)